MMAVSAHQRRLAMGTKTNHSQDIDSKRMCKARIRCSGIANKILAPLIERGHASACVRAVGRASFHPPHPPWCF